jgi:hypothetical protein
MKIICVPSSAQKHLNTDILLVIALSIQLVTSILIKTVKSGVGK